MLESLFNKIYYNTDVFLWNLPNFWEPLFWRTSANDCFLVFLVWDSTLVLFNLSSLFVGIWANLSQNFLENHISLVHSESFLNLRKNLRKILQFWICGLPYFPVTMPNFQKQPTLLKRDSATGVFLWILRNF